jgi:hypothetical protein
MISSQEFWGTALVTAPFVFLHAGQGSDPDKNNELLEISLEKPAIHRQNLRLLQFLLTNKALKLILQKR